MRKIFSKLLILGMLVAMTIMLAGCDIEVHYTIDKKGNISTDVTEWVSAEESLEFYNMFAGEGQTLTSDTEKALFAASFGEQMEETEGYIGKKIGDDDRVYYGIAAENSGYNIDDVANPEFTITTSEFIYNPLMIDNEEFLNQADYADKGLTEDAIAMLEDTLHITYSVTMPNEIVSTNGKLSKDKKTATFKFSNTEERSYYAFTAEAKYKVALDGTFDGKYTRLPELTVLSNDKVKSVKVNGVEQTSGTIATKKDGTYEVEVITENSDQFFKVIKDTAAPKVSGVKNKKTYDKSVKIKFSDKASGIRSATLNGEPISNKKKVKAEGEYTLVVTDNAGNTKTVNFTIKK